MTANAGNAGDPISRILAWYDDAREAGLPLANAIALATATPDGAPSARMVLFKGVTDRGAIRFVTDYRSRKADEIEANPRAAIVWHWPTLGRQIRVEGTVARLAPPESDALHAARPRGSQLSVWSSTQSRPVDSRDFLLAAREAAARRFPEGTDVPRPPYWGGYALTPLRVEFWEERPDRFHHRERYDRRTDGGWQVMLLQP
jgi:pyridoxamine 5'-phosphate oxidase